MCVVIPRNTTIPVQRKEIRRTVKDYQTRATLRIFEGERTRTEDNKLLGEFTLAGIQVALRGVANIELSFDLQDNGILKVSARDTSTGSVAGITITCGSLSKEEIEDASRLKADDEMHRKKGEARLAFEVDACEMRDSLKNMNSGDKKRKAEDAIQEAFEWLDSRKELAEVFEYEEKMKKLKRIFN